MNKNLLLILYSLLIIYGCKNHDSMEDSVFSVVMEVGSDKNTKFQMYYMEEGDEKFTKDKMVEGVIDISSSNGVKFELPKNSFPISLRFDFGEKRINKNFKFESMMMTYKDLKMNINLAEFSAFFRPNEYISFDKDSGEILCKAIDGRYDPFFISRPLFNKRLEIEKR